MRKILILSLFLSLCYCEIKVEANAEVKVESKVEVSAGSVKRDECGVSKPQNSQTTRAKRAKKGIFNHRTSRELKGIKALKFTNLA